MKRGDKGRYHPFSMSRNSHKKITPKNEDVTFEPVSSEREMLVELLVRRVLELEAQLVAAQARSERSIT